MRKIVGLLAFLSLVSVSVVFAEGGEGGVEAALVTYRDVKAGVSIGYPSTWSRDPGFTKGIRFVGGDDTLEVQIVSDNSGTDIKTFAQNNEDTLAREFPSFKKIALKASPEIRGAWIVGFEAADKSQITGKPFMAHNERYYIPLKDHRIGMVTVTGPANHYDREGIRDIALTLSVQ